MDERLKQLNEELDRLYESRRKSTNDREQCLSLLLKQRKAVDAKKEGNGLLVMAVLTAILVIVLLLLGNNFSVWYIVLIALFLIPGIKKKVSGKKKYEQLSKELDAESVGNAAETLELVQTELDCLKDQIHQVRNEIDDLMKYRGKEWRLAEIDPKDGETQQALLKDLKAVVAAINYSDDKMFISNNWLINNIMLYFTAGLQKKQNTLDRYHSVFQVLRECDPWPLKFLDVLITVGSIKLTIAVSDINESQDWDASCRSTNLPKPVGTDNEFYVDAKKAADKAVKLVAKEIRKTNGN